MNKAATGEGSRGGHVIGHTAGGKPIYATENALTSKEARAERIKHMTPAEIRAAGGKSGRHRPGAKRLIERAEHHERMTVHHHERAGGRYNTVPHGIEGEHHADAAAAHRRAALSYRWAAVDPRSKENRRVAELHGDAAQEKTAHAEAQDALAVKKSRSDANSLSIGRTKP